MSGSNGPARPWVIFSLVLNVILLGALIIVFALSRSQLVMAQGADSLMDIGAGAILAFTATVGGRPRDADHPFGHGRAEPLGALIAAVLAGVLAFEVAKESILALTTGRAAELDRWVLMVLLAKVLVKATWFAALLPMMKRHRSPALRAIFVDTRNDVVACVSSVAGFGLAKAGWLAADALLALPVACYIGWNGLELARENIRYLMGEAPDGAIDEELRQRVVRLAGVLELVSLRSHYVGQFLHVEVVILVRDGLTGTEVHDIAVDVEQSVEAHPLVGRAFVHCDTNHGKPHAEEPRPPGPTPAAHETDPAAPER